MLPNCCVIALPPLMIVGVLFVVDELPFESGERSSAVNSLLEERSSSESVDKSPLRALFSCLLGSTILGTPSCKIAGFEVRIDRCEVL